MTEAGFSSLHLGVGHLVLRLEKCLDEPKTELRQRRIQNYYALAKHQQIPLPSLKALLAARKRLRLAQAALDRLPPHQRAEVAKLAQEIGDNSNLFQIYADTSFDTDLQALR